MSSTLIRLILEDGRFTIEQRAIFVYLVNLREWIVPKSSADIRSDLKVAERTYSRAMKMLEDEGFVFREGWGKGRRTMIAPPSVIYDLPNTAKTRRINTANNTATTQRVNSPHRSNGIGLNTANNTATPPKKAKRVIKPKPKPKLQSSSIQNRLFGGGTKVESSDGLEAETLPRDLDELYQEYLTQIEDRFGLGPTLPSALTGQNRGKWREKLVAGLMDEEGLYTGTMAVRLMVWDWERIRKKWKAAFGDEPYPTPDAIWKLAERAIPLIETGCRGTGKGNDRGPSAYAKRFLTEDGGKTDEISPEDW